MSLFFFVIGLQVLLFRSRWGLRTRAVGEHPKAADTVGIDVIRTRYRSVILGGVFAGLAGAYLTLEQFNSFQDNMTGGVGFIGLAAMIFGRWTPLGAYGAALLFGDGPVDAAGGPHLATGGRPRRDHLARSRRRSSGCCRTSSRSSSWRASSAGPSRRPPTASRTTRRPGADATTAPRGARAAERARARPSWTCRGTGSVPVLDDDGIETSLRATRRIAVVGASSDPARPSFGVFRHLLAAGFDCVPVNPNERTILGVPAFPTSPTPCAATGPFDLVDVFRRSELCVPHAERGGRGRGALPVAAARLVSWEAARSRPTAVCRW